MQGFSWIYDLLWPWWAHIACPCLTREPLLSWPWEGQPTLPPQPETKNHTAWILPWNNSWNYPWKSTEMDWPGLARSMLWSPNDPMSVEPSKPEQASDYLGRPTRGAGRRRAAAGGVEPEGAGTGGRAGEEEAALGRRPLVRRLRRWERGRGGGAGGGHGGSHRRRRRKTTRGKWTGNKGSSFCLFIKKN